jgi:hypothetical protein
MRRRAPLLRLALAGATCTLASLAALVGASCSGPSSQPSTAGRVVTLAPSVLAPQGLLDQIATFNLSIYAETPDSGIACNTATGIVSNTTGVTALFSSGHASSQCASGSKYCFVTGPIAQSETIDRVFAVTGYSDQAQTTPIAYGCATALVPLTDAAATLSVNITMEPIQVMAVCGSGVLVPPETCNEAPTDAASGVCQSCQTVEEVLSTGTGTADAATSSKTLTGKPGDKANPSFVWPVGQGSNFFALFGDTSSGSSQIDLRVLSDVLAPTILFSAITENDSIYLPNTPNGAVFPPNPEPHNQKQPAAVSIDGSTYIAFADDTLTPGTFAINLRSFDATLTPQEATACPVSTVTGAAAHGESGSLSAPAIAVASTNGSPVLYIAWQDSAGQIYGRVYTPTSSGCGTAGTQALLSTGSSNSSVSLAGIPSGFVAVWKSGSDIVIGAIGFGGAPAGTAQAIEDTGHVGSNPSVAAITSGGEVGLSNVGAFAVAWSDIAPGSSSSTIYAQRYYGTGSMKGQSIENPTQISVSSNGGGEVTPFIAASATATGSYVVAWADEGAANQIRGRYLSGTLGSLSVASAPAASSAYLMNPVDGTTGEFPIGVAQGRTRTNPTVVVGGGGGSSLYNGNPFVAFGWVDSTPGATSGYGIIARRFPAPSP